MSNTTETVFTVEVEGEGTNVAGFPRHIRMSRDFTRSELEAFVIEDLRGSYQDKTEALVKAMDDEELAEHISCGIAELEIAITGDADELLAHASWDVGIKA